MQYSNSPQTWSNYLVHQCERQHLCFGISSHQLSTHHTHFTFFIDLRCNGCKTQDLNSTLVHVAIIKVYTSEFTSLYFSGTFPILLIQAFHILSGDTHWYRLTYIQLMCI